MPVGLENILSCIDQEAVEESENIINEAKTRADNILAKAHEFAKKESELIIKNTEKKVNLILKRAETKAFLQERELNLKSKHEMVCFIIDEAKKVLYNLPDEEYFSLIFKLCKKYFKPSKCKMIFSAADLNRITNTIREKILKLADDVGTKIEISDKTRNIDGGFILSYGDVEENCSFESLIESNFDLLCDKINEILFS